MLLGCRMPPERVGYSAGKFCFLWLTGTQLHMNCGFISPLEMVTRKGRRTWPDSWFSLTYFSMDAKTNYIVLQVANICFIDLKSSSSLKPTRDFEPTEGVCPYRSQDHQTSANQALASGRG